MAASEKIQVVGYRNALHLRYTKVFPKDALDVGHQRRATEEAHVAAVIAQPAQAEIAGVAGEARVDRNTLARPYFRDCRADVLDLAGHLVPKHQRFAKGEVADPALVEVVQGPSRRFPPSGP